MRAENVSMKRFLRWLFGQQKQNLYLISGADISPEQAQEYREVAALVCIDLDILAETVERYKTLEEYKRMIRYIHKRKERAISDPQWRRERFSSGCLIFGLSAQGVVK